MALSDVITRVNTEDKNKEKQITELINKKKEYYNQILGILNNNVDLYKEYIANYLSAILRKFESHEYIDELLYESLKQDNIKEMSIIQLLQPITITSDDIYAKLSDSVYRSIRYGSENSVSYKLVSDKDYKILRFSKDKDKSSITNMYPLVKLADDLTYYLRTDTNNMYDENLQIRLDIIVNDVLKKLRYTEKITESLNNYGLDTILLFSEVLNQYKLSTYIFILTFPVKNPMFDKSY